MIKASARIDCFGPAKRRVAAVSDAVADIRKLLQAHGHDLDDVSGLKIERTTDDLGHIEFTVDQGCMGETEEIEQILFHVLVANSGAVTVEWSGRAYALIGKLDACPVCEVEYQPGILLHGVPGTRHV